MVFVGKDSCTASHLGMSVYKDDKSKKRSNQSAALWYLCEWITAMLYLLPLGMLTYKGNKKQRTWQNFLADSIMLI